MTNDQLERLRSLARGLKNTEPVKPSSKEIKPQPIFSSDSFYGHFELINGEWFYRVTKYFSNSPRITELVLSGVKRIIFDGVTFNANDKVILNWNCNGNVDMLNECDTKTTDEPVIIEFNNCSGIVGIDSVYTPVVYINSDYKRDIVLYSCCADGFCVDFFNITGSANVIVDSGENPFYVRALNVSENANLRIDSKALIEFLLKTNRVTYMSPVFSVVRYGTENVGNVYIEFDNSYVPNEALCDVSENDINYLVFSKLLKQIEDHKFKYQCHVKGIESYREGSMTSEEIIEDFVVTYQLCYIYTKGTCRNCNDSGYIF